MSEPATESLKAQFDALHAERETSWDPAKLRANIAQRRALVGSFDPTAIVQTGERVADFTLGLSTGGTVSLDDLISDGPALLIFFRFAGCPACNIALPYYDRQLSPALQDAGVRLVAVSPHLPERGLDVIRTRHGLGYDVAADRGNVLGRRFGLTFTPVDNPPAPTGNDSWIGALTDTGTWELPQPAAILIDQDHVVRFVDVSPDWLERTEAPTILTAVKSLFRVTA